MAQLTRDEVARRLQIYYRARFSGGSLSVYFDEMKRAYCVTGSGLDPHESMRAQYPNGWSLLDYDKPAKARKLIAGKSDDELVAEGLRKAEETRLEADRVTKSGLILSNPTELRGEMEDVR